MQADLWFYLSWFLISSCVFSRSGGTETELADLGPPVGLQLRGMRKAISPIELVAPGEFPGRVGPLACHSTGHLPAMPVPDSLTSVKTG